MSRIHRIAASPGASALAFILNLGTLAKLGYEIFLIVVSKEKEWSHIPLWLWILLASAILFYAATVFHSFKSWRGRGNLAYICQKLCELNKFYREQLQSVFKKKIPKEMIPREMEIGLSNACNIISCIYRNNTGEETFVAIKKMIRHIPEGIDEVRENMENPGVCATVARSHNAISRDSPDDVGWTIREFEVGNGKNTAFDTAFFGNKRNKDTYQTAYCFVSGNLNKLKKDGDYENERDDWHRLYKSCIVVPIRDLTSGTHYGYLCIDQKAHYKLDQIEHVSLARALGAQMFNYFSFISGGYIDLNKIFCIQCPPSPPTTRAKENPEVPEHAPEEIIENPSPNSPSAS